MRFRLIVTVMAVAAGLLTSCSGPSTPAVESKILRIEIQSESPFEAGTELRIKVIEISGPDRKNVVNTAVPAPAPAGVVEVAYNPAQVLEQHDYNLEVMAMRGGARVAGSDGDHLVLSKGRGDRVQVKLRK